MDKIVRRNKDVAVTKTAEPSVAMKATNASQDVKRKPLTTLRIDDCSASIWAREYSSKGKSKVYYSASFERSYKAASGEWKYTKSFDLESLGKLITVCQQASETITGLMQQNEAA